MKRPSCADPFSVQVLTTLSQILMCFLLPLRSKQATFCFDMVELAVVQHQRPGRREKARQVFALGPFVPTIQTNTVRTIQIKSPLFPLLSPCQPYLQGTSYRPNLGRHVAHVENCSKNLPKFGLMIFGASEALPDDFTPDRLTDRSPPKTTG